MIPLRKPRSDSVLKTLPAESLAEIVAYTRTHSLRATVQWLAGLGVKTACPEVSKFLPWHTLRQKLKEDLTTIAAIVKNAGQDNPLLGEHELNTLGQCLFALQAIRDRDLRGFVALRKLALAREIHEFSADPTSRTDLPALPALEADETLTHDKKPPLSAEKLSGRPQEPTPAPHPPPHDHPPASSIHDLKNLQFDPLPKDC